MRQILHILTRADDPLAQTIIQHQREQPDQSVQTIDLTAPDADYKALLRDIFTADSVEVW